MPELTVGGVRIHYVSAQGSPRGPAIVFLHGAGANHTIWLAQMKALRDRAWVVVPDLPGHGRSAAIPGLSIDEYAGALIPFLEEMARQIPEGLRRDVFLAGHSMGGAIALSIALRRPDLVAGLVLIGSGAKLRVSPELLQGLVESPSETQALIARWSFAPDADPGLVLRTMKDLVGTPAARTLADFRACDAFDLRERLGEITAPALVICGREDRLTPLKYSEFLRDRVRRAELRLIDGAGHAVMIERPAEVSEAIAGFLVRAAELQPSSPT